VGLYVQVEMAVARRVVSSIEAAEAGDTLCSSHFQFYFDQHG
jgi:hypothetical protein